MSLKKFYMDRGEEKGPTYILATVASVNTSKGIRLKFDGTTEATQKFYKCNSNVDFYAGDRVKVSKDGGTYVVESKIGLPGSAKARITFYIAGVEQTADENMTALAWVRSAYNTGGYVTMLYNGVIAFTLDYVNPLGYFGSSTSNYILPQRNYTMDTVTFTIAGTTYTGITDLSLGDWLNTAWNVNGYIQVPIGYTSFRTLICSPAGISGNIIATKAGGTIAQGKAYTLETITITIAGTNYTAAKGMSISDWVSSSLNTRGFTKSYAKPSGYSEYSYWLIDNGTYVASIGISSNFSLYDGQAFTA